MSNPVLTRLKPDEYTRHDPNTLTLTWDDIILRTGAMLTAVVAGAVVVYSLIGSGALPIVPTVVVSAIAGLVLVIVATVRSQGAGAILSMSYAVVEGVFVGAVTFMFANYSLFNGGEPNGQQIITSAILGTIGVFIGMLVAYKTKMIRVTPRFTKVVIAATFGILVLVIVNLVASLLGFNLGIRGGGPLAIIFSIVAIIVAALNLTLDFHYGDKMIEARAPVKASWNIALGLVVTLVWLYTEMLRIASILSGRN